MIYKGELSPEQRLSLLEVRVASLERITQGALQGGDGAKREQPSRIWWPTSFKPAYITQFFGENYANYIKFGLPGHEGLDIRTGVDGKIICIADGVVIRVDAWPNAGNYGYSIRVKHESLGLTSVYCHLNPSVLVPPVGTELRAGAIIGKAGSTGNSTAIHLHLTIKDDQGRMVDPLSILADAYHEAGGMQSLPDVKTPMVLKA